MNQSTGLREWRRRFATTVPRDLLAATVLTAVLSVSMGGSASSVSAVQVTAPFPRGHTQVALSASQVSPGQSVVTSPPSFHWRSGIGVFGANSSSRTCGGGCRDSGGVAYATLYLKILIPAVSGATSVFVNWTVFWNLTVRLIPGCAFRSGSTFQCSGLAYAQFDAGSYPSFEDLTNRTGTYSSSPGIYVSNSSSFSDSCSNGRCSNSTSGHVPGSTNNAGGQKWSLHFQVYPMNSTHRYAVFLEFDWSVYAAVASSGTALHGARADSRIDMASPGNGVTLRSILVS